MIWDARVWSFFMWIIATALFLCGFVTPYNMPGNVRVAFGGNVNPLDENFIGLWGDVPEALQSTMMAVQGLCCVTCAGFVASFVMYIILFKRSSPCLQGVACAANVLAGILAIVAVCIYRAASDQLGEGFYFVAAAGGLSVLNGIVLVLIPWMEYVPPKWKQDSNTAEAVPLKKMVSKTDDNANA